jgi:Zn finger protein HypA/HybF involved in hydrogenase expression
MDFGKINMHDFILAKEIIDELSAIIKEKKLESVKKVNVEIGMISLAHDGHPQHSEDISVENLQFGLASIAKNTPLEKVEFGIKKVAGDHWRITEIEV